MVCRLKNQPIHLSPTNKMKNKLFWIIKKLLNRAGYDITKYHPSYDILLQKYDFKTVLDIGANDGQFATDIHKRLPKAQIYSFEPLKESFAKLSENMSEVKNFKAFNFALGEQSGTMEISRSAFSPSSSLRKMASLHKEIYPKSAMSVKEEITIKRLDDVLSGIKFEKPLLIKIDVQGYEDKVILGALKTLPLATMIVTETSFVTLYEGQPLFGDIHDLLRPLGFSYHGSKERHWNPKTGEVLYEDSIFLK